MNNKISYPSVEAWFLCYNVLGESPFSYGSVSSVQEMKTPLETIETFDSVEELYIRMDELNYEYYTPPIEEEEELI